MALTTCGDKWNKVDEGTDSNDGNANLNLEAQENESWNNTYENIIDQPETPLPTNDINAEEWELLNELLEDSPVTHVTPMPSPIQDFLESHKPGDKPIPTPLHHSPVPDASRNDIPNEDACQNYHPENLPPDKRGSDLPVGAHQENVHVLQISESSPQISHTPNTPFDSISSVNSLTSLHSTPVNIKRKSTFKSDEGVKRKRHEVKWIDVKRKQLKNSGQEYQTRKGITVPEKKMGPICQNTCKFKCHEMFTQEVCQNIFVNFWKVGDHSKQWEYIDKFTERKCKKRITTEGPSRRTYTTTYYLPLPGVNAINTYEKAQVCLKTFCNTLSISDRFIRTAINKTNQEGSVVSDDRGKHFNHPTKISAMKKSVCDHVLSFQPVESHYTRKDSSKLYLDGSLSFAKMFALYKTWHQLDRYETKAETLRQYRDIVNENMNISFFVPKKDICDKCHSFDNENNPTEDQVQAHGIHIANKNSAREMKTKDKLSTQSTSPKIVCATFDFQKILNIPHGDVGLFYYKRKLSMYNFTVFDVAVKEGICYMWAEYTAKRGANEVSSCLMMFIIERVNSGASEFKFWSDNCPGQNRNRIVYTAYMYLSKKLKIDITHRFLEQGHTQSEGDSVHALIERESKGKMIYTPDQWYALVRWAKTLGKPYKVQEVSQDEVFDFKPLMENRNWKKSTTNETVKWNKIKEVHVKQTEPNSIYFKYAFDEDYQCLNTVVETRRGKRNALATNTELKCLYSDLIPIQSEKHKDLQSLCTSNVIPKQYHKFYVDLKYGERQTSPEKDE